jgi:sugar lactone lactonase YvrE
MKKTLFIYMILQIFVYAESPHNDSLYLAVQFTNPNSFTEGVEGPAVDKNGNLYAVNFMRQGTIGKVTPDGKASVFAELPKGSVGNGIRFARNGDMFIADYTKHNILKVDRVSKKVTVFVHSDKMNQPNDIAITDNDIIYISDPNWADSTGNLWMADQEGNLKLLESDMSTTNGVEVSPDNRTLYVGESVKHRILAYDILSNGEIVHKRLFKQFKDEIPDGMRTDSLGNLYVACYKKGRIHILSPSGETIRQVDLHGDKVTNLAFGGIDGKTCYVTVAGNGNIEMFRTAVPGRSWVMNRP